MYDVAVYMSSLPRVADRNRKTEVLQAFAQGAQAQGANTLIEKSRHVVPANLAVILGWVGNKIAGPHIQLRRNVIDAQHTNNRQVMAIDGSCFKFADPNSKWLRYSLGGVFYNQNNYANQNSTSTKWDQIRHDLEIEVRPWRTNGNHVLICLQRDGGWNMKGVDMQNWSMQTVTRIRQLTDRPIVVRPHPKTNIDTRYLQTIPNTRVSNKDSSLADDLRNAWCSVFFNSSSCVASILAGVPVVSLDSDSVAWAVSSHSVENINEPSMPDRTQWLNDLAACHWNDEESRSGLIYNKFRQFLPA